MWEELKEITKDEFSTPVTEAGGREGVFQLLGLKGQEEGGILGVWGG